MINWNKQSQVDDTLWGEHKELEDHIVPQPKEHDRDSLCNFERCSKKQRSEIVFNATSSNMETGGSKYDIKICQPKSSADNNTSHELNDANIDIDTWPDLPNLSMPYGMAQSSDIHSLASDLVDTSDFKSVGGFMEEYNNSSGLINVKNSSSLSKVAVLLSNKEMQLDREGDLFRHADKENDKFLDYDFGNIEDFDDFDKIFRNNNLMFRNEVIDNADTFLSTSPALVSCPQTVPVPGISILRDQSWEEASSSIQLSQHSDVKTIILQKGEGDLQNKSDQASKSQDEKEKEQPLEGLNNSWYNKIYGLQASTVSPLLEFQAPFMEQSSSSHPTVLTDYGYPSYQFHGVPLSPQIHAEKNHERLFPRASKSLIMTPREKIEKLRRRQQMQAMLAIQKQREQYNHPISSGDEAPTLPCVQNGQNQGIIRSSVFMDDYPKKFASSEPCCEAEQPQMMSSLFEGCSVEEIIYYQLQGAMGKLDLKVRLSICDSLYRLARSAMERQNVNDQSSANKSNEEGETSADGKSYNNGRYSKMEDLEAVTNPMDRIVAHLLFHNPSGSSSLMPIADGDMAMAASM